MEERFRILIIEDDQEISRLLCMIIEKAGMVAVSAFSGTEGLLQLQQNSYDLVLLDLMLPGLSGEEFIMQVREGNTLPIIVISAKVAPERAFSKRQIYEGIWTGPYLGDDNTISVHVSNIRKKMAGITSVEYIKTILGVGFILI